MRILLFFVQNCAYFGITVTMPTVVVQYDEFPLVVFLSGDSHLKPEQPARKPLSVNTLNPADQ